MRNSSAAMAVLIQCLRSNSRMSLKEMSRATGVSQAALGRALAAAEKGHIVRYVSLLEPQLAGFGIRVNYIVRGRDEGRLVNFIALNPNVNSCSRLAERGLLAIECFFRDMKELDGFREGVVGARAKIVDEAFVTEELKREGFMCSDESIEKTVKSK